MLVDKEVQINYVLVGHANARTTKVLLTYEKLGFYCEISKKGSNSQHHVLKKLNQQAFELFRDGKFTFTRPQTQNMALEVISRNDTQLIETMYTKDPLELYIVKKELKARNIYDADIYYMGFYGVEQSKNYAIEMLKEKITKRQKSTCDPFSWQSFWRKILNFFGHPHVKYKRAP